MWDQLLFDPPFSASYILLLGGVVAVLTIANYVRTRNEAGAFSRVVLTALRLAVVAGMTVILLRPMVIAPAPAKIGKSVFTVLVDGSRSMATTDVEGRARFEVVREQLEHAERELFLALRNQYDVRFALFSDSLGRAPFDQILVSTPDQSAHTDIATTLMNAGQEAPGVRHAGILLISDGRDNNGRDPLAAATYLRASGVPVWTTTVGTTDETKDLVVTARFDQSFLFRDQPSELNVALHQKGFDGWYAKVELLRNGEPVGTQQAMLNQGTEQLTFPILEDTRGTYRYTVQVEPLAGEADPNNNERTVFVQVVDERAKVLLVEAEPYWDSKFLLRALQADPNLEVSAIFGMSSQRDKMIYVTQALPEGEAGDQSGSSGLRVPRTREEFFSYDCIILGRDVEQIFDATQIALLKEYVEVRGGGLIFARGKAYAGSNETLSEMEPLIWDEGNLENIRFELTSAGNANPIFNLDPAQSSDLIIRELPEMISITRVKEEKSLSIVLAKGVGTSNDEEIAAISYQRYGKGKVMTVGSSGLWQWAFMKNELAKYDAVYARFWGQTIRWLVYDSDFLPGQNISFKTDRYTYNSGDSVALLIQSKEIETHPIQPEVVITTPGGQSVRVDATESEQTPGLFRATYFPDGEGAFTAALVDNGHGQGELVTEFSVYSNDLESRFVGADPDLMDQIAAISGGAPLDFEAWDSLPGRLTQHEESMTEESKPEDAWDRGDLFAALVLVLGMEWFIRRRTGLL